MHYFIDGYNLMFQTLEAGDDLQYQREELIESLHEKIQLLNLDVTIVFDAHYQWGGGSRFHLKDLEICFTDEGETADDYILQEIKRSKNPKLETVVTSDNRLAWKARRLLANTQTVKNFLGWLNKRARSQKRRSPVVKPPTPRETISKKSKPLQEAPPKPANTIEGSFDYYLYTFEKMDQDRKQKKKKQNEQKD